MNNRNPETMKIFDLLLNGILLIFYQSLISFKDSYSFAMGNPDLLALLMSISI